VVSLKIDVSPLPYILPFTGAFGLSALGIILVPVCAEKSDALYPTPTPSAIIRIKTKKTIIPDVFCLGEVNDCIIDCADPEGFAIDTGFITGCTGLFIESVMGMRAYLLGFISKAYFRSFGNRP